MTVRQGRELRERCGEETMTRDVLIKISGLQMMDEDSDNVEVITTGDYFLKNGKHYIIYDEVLDGFDGSIRNTVKISPDTMDVRKQGVIGAHMEFAVGKKSMTRYATPVGEMIVEISTNEIRVEEQEDNLKVQVDYSLDINYEHVSDCSIMMDVSSRETATLNL